MADGDCRVVIRPGAAVEIGPADHPIDAMVTQVTIGSVKVQYLVVWYDGKSRREEWLDPIEVREKDGETYSRVRIGFQ